MVALPPHDVSHEASDSERLLRTFGEWHQEWGGEGDCPNATFTQQVEFATQAIANGAGPLRLPFLLIERFGERCQVKRVIQKAYRAIQDAASLPQDIQRAAIQAQRATAIQNAIQDRAWGPALSGLARAGDVAGELRDDVGLGPEDLRLVVEVEGETAQLEAGQGGPLPDTNPDQGPVDADTISDQAEA